MNIINFLNKKYPQENSEKWDPVGFSFSFNENYQNVLLCLDVTPEVIDYAVQNKVDTIISHHPFLFFPTLKEEFEKAPYKRNVVKKIKQNQINVFSIHTNFDGTKNSTAMQIAKDLKFNKKNIFKIDKYNILVKEKYSIELIIQKINKIGLINLASNFNLNDNLDKNIESIAILPGSGGIEAIVNASKNKADLIITSDLKWSDWLTVKYSLKKSLVLEVCHIIEEAFISKISEDLSKKFPEVKIFKFKTQEIKLNI